MGGEAVFGSSPVVCIRDVAKRSGWSYVRMKRHLLKLDRELGGLLLTKSGEGGRTRYTTTLGALEQVRPQWFTRQSALLEEVSDHEARLRDQSVMVDDAHRDIGSLRTRIQRLEGDVRKLTERLTENEKRQNA